jgi:formate-dependent phosphoribosylglycinamide formyltransferase (GAR transformylase)
MSYSFNETEAEALEAILRRVTVADEFEQELLLDLIEAISERDLIDFESEELAIDPEAIAKNTKEFFEILRNK